MSHQEAHPSLNNEGSTDNEKIRDLRAIETKLRLLSQAPEKDFTVSGEELLAVRKRINTILAELSAALGDIEEGHSDGLSPEALLLEVQVALDEIDKFCVSDVVDKKVLDEVA